MERIAITEKATKVLEQLKVKHGDLIFHQSGGCCDGSAPMLFEKGDMYLDESDILLGTLNTIAKPEGYYSQDYLESRNTFYVTEWNNRVRSPLQYNRNIYENIIDYQSNVDYGYDVNYKLFNYFEFAQQKYKMSLGTSGKYTR